jgi:VCBS repeat protein/Big-like domain-containing protein
MNPMLYRTTSIVFLVTIVFATLINAQTFRDTSYSSPNGPTDVFAADLNHDGRPDLVSTQFSAGMVTVFLNHGDGTFTDGGSATYLTANSPRHVIVADLNGDGHPDIATASCPSGGAQPFASVLFGNGDGTFRTHVDYPIPQCAFSLGTLRVSGDKLPSLVIADGTHIQLLRNNGAGVFTLRTIVYPGSDIFLYATGADYNRDGFADIAFVEQNRPLNQNRLLIMNGKADGTFAAPRVIFATPAGGSSALFMDVINTVDVNGDGVGDLVTSFNNNGTHGGVLVFVNDQHGNFSRAQLNLASEQFENGKIAEGDFHGNGLHDIVIGAIRVANTGQDSVVIFPATSRTSWGAPKEFLMGTTTGPHSIVRGNFNSDSHLDFAFARFSPDSLHVFLNTQVGPCGLSPSAGVVICSPKAGSTVSSPVAISASANGLSRRITGMKAYVDGKLVATSLNSGLNTSVPLASGGHRLTVNAWDSSGKLYQASVTFNVR